MRIVSLLPSATEILFAIGAGDEVVGVTHECDYPPEALRLPKLTAAAGPDYATPGEIDRHVRESVHAGSSLYTLDRALLESLRPDLIVTQELCPVCAVSYDTVDAAAKQLCSEVEVVSLEPSSLKDVLENILFLGRSTAHEMRARNVVDELEARIRKFREKSKDVATRTRTLVLEWTDPPMSAGHWIPELIELAGGEPVLAHPGADSQRLAWDAIAATDPDAVIIAPCGFDLTKTFAAIGALDDVPQWRSLRARRSGDVLPMDGNAYLSRPGPRLVEAMETIADWFARAHNDGAEYRHPSTGSG
jgi:iron complex transport system substrate-binding protein